MNTTRTLGESIKALAATLVLLLPGIAAAQDRDAQEVQAYVLTDAGLAKYTQATRAMAALAGDQTGACEDHDDAQSISQAAARFDRFPAAKSAILATGMTPREYVVFSLAVLQTGLAAWGADQAGGKLPAGTSAANVAWYRKNEANLKKLETQDAYKDCEEFAEEDEEEE